MKYGAPQKDELRISSTSTSVSGTTFYWLEGARAQNAGSLPFCQGALVKELFSPTGLHHICCSVKNALWNSVCKLDRKQREIRGKIKVWSGSRIQLKFKGLWHGTKILLAVLLTILVCLCTFGRALERCCKVKSYVKHLIGQVSRKTWQSHKEQANTFVALLLLHIKLWMYKKLFPKKYTLNFCLLIYNCCWFFRYNFIAGYVM